MEDILMVPSDYLKMRGAPEPARETCQTLRPLRKLHFNAATSRDVRTRVLITQVKYLTIIHGHF